MGVEPGVSVRAGRPSLWGQKSRENACEPALMRFIGSKFGQNLDKDQYARGGTCKWLCLENGVAENPIRSTENREPGLRPCFIPYVELSEIFQI